MTKLTFTPAIREFISKFIKAISLSDLQCLMNVQSLENLRGYKLENSVKGSRAKPAEDDTRVDCKGTMTGKRRSRRIKKKTETRHTFTD